MKQIPKLHIPEVICVTEDYEKLLSNESVTLSDKPNSPKRKQSNKKYILVGIIIAIIALVVIILVNYRNIEKGTFYYLKFYCNIEKGTYYYQKDNSLYSYDMLKDKSNLIEDQLCDLQYLETEDGKENHNIDSLRLINHSKNNEIVVYPNKYGNEGLTYYISIPLYYSNLEQSKPEGLSICPQVYRYSINENGTFITYLSQNRSLYQLDTKSNKRELIEEEVSEYVTSDDGDIIGYIKESHDYTNSGSLYLKCKGKEPDMIDLDIESIEYASKNLSTICYIKDNELFIMRQGKNIEKVDANVDRIVKGYESGEFFYERVDSEPDEVKNELDSTSYPEPNMNVILCYYDGKESHVIMDHIDQADYLAPVDSISWATDHPVLLFFRNTANKYELDKYITTGDQTVKMESESADDICINNSGDIVYFIVEDRKEDPFKSTLYRMAIIDGVIKEPEIYEEDVSNVFITMTSDQSVVYYKNADINRGDLWIDHNMIEEGVRRDLDRLGFYRGPILYYTDWDYDKKSGTLKIYEYSHSKTIANNVNDIYVSPDNDVLFLCNKEEDKGGDLYIYHNHKTKLIDHDVISIIK